MFQMRTSLPDRGNKYYNTVSAGGYSLCIVGKCRDTGRPCQGLNVLANCVGYANGRFAEIIGKNKIEYQFISNAENFIEHAKRYGLKISDKPTPGGIMVWQKGNTLNPEDGAGHVAIVEKVIDDNTIYTSESGYNSTTFWNATRKNTNGRWGIGAGYSFRGCIVNPSVNDEPKPTPTPEPTPTPAPVKKEIALGDTVIVNGVGTASSTGQGARTGRFVNRKMKVIMIANNTSRPNRYALNQYDKGNINDSRAVTAWFSINDIKKA